MLPLQVSNLEASHSNIIQELRISSNLHEKRAAALEGHLQAAKKQYEATLRERTQAHTVEIKAHARALDLLKTQKAKALAAVESQRKRDLVELRAELERQFDVRESDDAVKRADAEEAIRLR